MYRVFAPAALVLAAILDRSAAAQACPPTVTLSGDAAEVAAIGELLSARGIASATAECPGIGAQIERRGETLVIELAPVDGPPIERVVGEATTAATVIESFTRDDVDAPLLAARALSAATVISARPPPPTVITVTAPRLAPRGVHVFGAFESSYAIDRTAWIGAHVGACVMLGPVCASARVRFATVEAGPGVWKDTVSRRGSELLVGPDVPLSIGRMTLLPGFAAGLGEMHTKGPNPHQHSETGGMRADVHVTLSIPLSAHLALDIVGAADLTQETRADIDNAVETMPLPNEPRLIVRAGIGLRYGGL